jgi:hypothetical protein
MKRNDDSSSMDNRATKKTRTLLDVQMNGPGLFDVICGRGRPYQEHHGNKRLHEIVAVYKSRYSKSKRHEKKGIAEMIVNSINNDQTQPGRFLKRTDDEDNEVWEEVSLANACEKVSHVLRFKTTSSHPPPILRFKNRSSQRPSQTEASTSDESGASSFPRVNNQSSMLTGLQPNNFAAIGQYTLEPRQHPAQEPLWNSRTLPALGLPAVASTYKRPTLPSSATVKVVQRPAAVGDFDMPSRARVGTAMSVRPNTIAGTDGAPPSNFSETAPVNLLSDEQVFLLEAFLIKTRRRARTNSPGIASSVRLP